MITIFRANNEVDATEWWNAARRSIQLLSLSMTHYYLNKNLSKPNRMVACVFMALDNCDYIGLSGDDSKEFLRWCQSLPGWDKCPLIMASVAQIH